MNKSRFAVLLEEPNIQTRNKKNHLNNNKQVNNSYSSSSKNNKSNFIISPKQVIAEMSFPMLEKNNKKITQNTVLDNNSFINKLKTQKIQSNNETQDECLPNGWVKIYMDKKTNCIEILYSPSDLNIEEEEPMYSVSAADIMNKVSKIHRERSNEFIEMWGIDAWEKEFLFKNNYYNYVDESDSDSEL
jgi:hypothetical protein